MICLLRLLSLGILFIERHDVSRAKSTVDGENNLLTSLVLL